MTQFTFTKAVRERVKLKALLTGPSGSGKTFGALALATAMAPGKVAMIDSEHDRGLYYADTFEFDRLALPNLKYETYMAALDAAVQAGYEVVVLDSLSHAWEELLERKSAEEARNPKANSYTLWNKYGEMWGDLIRKILECPVHLICTSRSKQAYEQVKDERGKTVVQKVGMAPQVRDGVEYEFALVFDLLISHSASVSKDNTQLFDMAETYDLTDSVLARKITAWVNGGVEAPARPLPTRTRDEAAVLQAENDAQPGPADRWKQPPLPPRAAPPALVPVLTIEDARAIVCKKKPLSEHTIGSLTVIITGIEGASADDRAKYARLLQAAQLVRTWKIAEENAALSALKVGAVTQAEADTITQSTSGSDAAPVLTAVGSDMPASLQQDPDDGLPF